MDGDFKMYAYAGCDQSDIFKTFLELFPHDSSKKPTTVVKLLHNFDAIGYAMGYVPIRITTKELG